MRRYPLVEKGSGLSLAPDEAVAGASDVFLEQDAPEFGQRIGWRLVQGPDNRFAFGSVERQEAGVSTVGRYALTATGERLAAGLLDAKPEERAA